MTTLEPGLYELGLAPSSVSVERATSPFPLMGLSLVTGELRIAGGLGTLNVMIAASPMAGEETATRVQVAATLLADSSPQALPVSIAASAGGFVVPARCKAGLAGEETNTVITVDLASLGWPGHCWVGAGSDESKVEATASLRFVRRIDTPRRPSSARTSVARRSAAPSSEPLDLRVSTEWDSWRAR